MTQYGELDWLRKGFASAAAAAAAAEGDAATVDAHGELSFSAAGGGGGSQTVNMVGPVAIAWNTAEIGNSPGIEVCEVAVGSVVLGVYFVPTDDWDGGAGQNYIQATSVISIGGGGGRDIAAWDLLDAKATHSDVLQTAPLNLSVGNTLLFHGGLPLQADATVNVHVITDGAGLHVGAADVYALIGTPAA